MTAPGRAAPPNGTAPFEGSHTSNALMTADDLAERWQVPRSQVYRLAREGRVPAVWIGRYVRFRPAEVDLLIGDASKARTELGWTPQHTFEELANQGFVLRQVSGYRVGVDVQFAAIWDRAEGVAFAGRHGLTSSQHQAMFHQLDTQGFRMTSVSGYSAYDTKGCHEAIALR